MTAKIRSLFRFWSATGSEKVTQERTNEEALATLLGYLAVCDKPLNEREKQAFKTLVETSAFLSRKDSPTLVEEAFSKAASAFKPLPTQFVFDFYWENRFDKERLWFSIEALLRLASSDGPMNSLEGVFLETVVRAFGLSTKEYHRLQDRIFGGGSRTGNSKSGNSGKSTHENSSSRPPPRKASAARMERAEALKILGCRESASIQEIKRAYRRKAKEYHYDKIVHTLKSPESLSEASEHFLLIQKAYESLCS